MGLADRLARVVGGSGSADCQHWHFNIDGDHFGGTEISGEGIYDLPCHGSRIWNDSSVYPVAYRGSA